MSKRKFAYVREPTCDEWPADENVVFVEPLCSVHSDGWQVARHRWIDSQGAQHERTVSMNRAKFVERSIQHGIEVIFVARRRFLVLALLQSPPDDWEEQTNEFGDDYDV